MWDEQIFKVACIQFNPILNKRDENIKALSEVIREAAENGAKLIVTPEMATTGYYYRDRLAIEPFVDTIPGSTTTQFEKICRKYNMYVVIGMPEVDPETDLYYNSAALIGPEGYIGKYRKIHLWEWEAHWSAVGDLGMPVMTTPLGKIAINICMDSIFFESSRLALLQGADILAFPTNSSAQSISFLQARAEMNGLYVLSANRSDEEHHVQMVGASAIWSPFGEKLVEAPLYSTQDDSNNPVIIYATINKEYYRNIAKQRISERVPSSYKEMMNYIAPWDFTKSSEEKKICAAVVQYEPIAGNKEANYKIHEQYIAEIKEKDKSIRLVVLPELATTGPVNEMKVTEIFALADEIDSVYIQKYQQLAIKYNLSIIFGMIERDGEQIYNTALLLNNFGIIEGKYRKVHLTESDQRWAQPGDKVEVFETNQFGKIGLLIGYDAAFPEIAAVLAVKRADTIVIPSLWNGEFGRELEINKNISKNRYPAGSNCVWDAIALGCQAYVIIANPIGTKYELGGRSALYTLDPLYGLDQPIIASANEEEIVFMRYTTIQGHWWFNQEKLITLRRTNEYTALVI